MIRIADYWRIVYEQESICLLKDGTVVPFNGDMDDYARLVLERAKGGSAPSQLRPAKAKRDKKQKFAA